MAAEISPELLKKCLENMELFDVPDKTRQFCQDAMYLEFEMSSVPGDFKKTFSNHDDEDDDADGGGDDDDDDDAKMHRLSTNFDDYSTVLQATLASFKRWTDRLKNLTDTSKLLPPLKVTEGKVKQLKAPYYLKAGEVSIQEGELIDVLDDLQDSTLKVKVGQDREGQIPILSLIMPSSDFSFTTLMERLHVVLLCAWFECFRLFYQRLFRLLLITLDVLSYTYPPNVSSHAKGPKVPKDLKVLKKIVVRLEQDCLEKKDGKVSKSDELVSKLSKAYKCYKIFEKLLKNFKVPDEADKLRPLCIFDKLSEFQSRVPKDKPIKYYKTKIVIESVETREEILHYPATDSSSTISDSSAHQTKVESERLTSSSQEVQKRFVVKAVRDPRTGKDISLDDAIKAGVLDMNRGFYINPTTGASKPIPAAMNEGLIKVEAVTETVSKQKSEEMGILTVKSLISENREYKVIQTVDPITAEKLNPEAAKKRGWLMEEGYKVENRVIPMDEAIEIGWVQVEYLSSSSEFPEDSKYEARTYLIRSVRDERRNRSLGFTEAISSGLIDVDMGCYVDSQTRDKISLDEALRLGVVKGRRLREGEDPGALVSNPGNRVIAGNIGKFKTIATALTGFGVKSDYKHMEGDQL